MWYRWKWLVSILCISAETKRVCFQLTQKAAAGRWKAISIDHDALTTIDKHQIQYVYIYHSEFIDIAHIPLKFYTNVTWKHQYLQTTVWHRDHSNADYIWTKHLPEADTIQSHFTNLIWCALSWFCLISRAVFLHNVCKESVLISFVHYKASGLVPWSVVKLYRTNMKCASQIDITNDWGHWEMHMGKRYAHLMILMSMSLQGPTVSTLSETNPGL